jgi:hypothetical protein
MDDLKLDLRTCTYIAQLLEAQRDSRLPEPVKRQVAWTAFQQAMQAGIITTIGKEVFKLAWQRLNAQRSEQTMCVAVPPITQCLQCEGSLNTFPVPPLGPAPMFYRPFQPGHAGTEYAKCCSRWVSG